ncbi:hypothetical protein CCMA1212_009846 [Trichoderma ghanense]|uniref:Uncharacterized protein n=1 Tax=Trichoderma ghanense TaxID=65468 RepID=A0ABY2GR56_9HYPO
MDNGVDSPPSYGSHQHALLPPPYYSQEHDPVAAAEERWRADGIFSPGTGRSGTLSRCWRWIAKELAASTRLSSDGRNSDMCFGACCRG